MRQRNGLTPKMRYALNLLQSCTEDRHAVTITQPTRPVGDGDAFVNVATARALATRGLLTFSGGGDEPAYEWVSLTDAGRAA